MTSEDLKKKVAEILQGEPSEPYHDVLVKLRELAEAIEAALLPGVEARVEVGYQVNKGQQYSFVIRIPGAGYQTTLFRAYVPVDGFPVSLDLFEEQNPTCGDLETLEKEVLQFLDHRAVKQRLRAMKDLATQHALDPRRDSDPQGAVAPPISLDLTWVLWTVGLRLDAPSPVQNCPRTSP